MGLDPWDEIDVTSWAVESPELRGKRAKTWVVAPDGAVWLRKQPLDTRPSEIAIEAITARIARAVGLDAPVTHACVWSGANRGLLIKRFLDPEHETLSSGFERLRVTYADYDPEKHGHHTLKRVMSTLDFLELDRPGADLVHPFAQMLTFDAWVGNSDRHQENWAMNVRGWVASFEAQRDAVVEFLATVPDRWLSPPRRDFARTLLLRRLLWLKDRLP